jgi:hypothetical protein
MAVAPFIACTSPCQSPALGADADATNIGASLVLHATGFGLLTIQPPIVGSTRGLNGEVSFVASVSVAMELSPDSFEEVTEDALFVEFADGRRIRAVDSASKTMPFAGNTTSHQSVFHELSEILFRPVKRAPTFAAITTGR